MTKEFNLSKGGGDQSLYQAPLIAIRKRSWIITLGVSEEEGTHGMPDQSAGRGGMRIQPCQSESMTLGNIG